MSLCWILIDAFSLFRIIWLSSFSVPCTTLYLHQLRRVAACPPASAGTASLCLLGFVFLFFLRFFMSCICARTCFMVNKQAFFPRRHQSLSAADQIAGRSAETALWKMDLGRSANFSQFGASVSHSHTFQKAGCLLPLTTLYSPPRMGQQQSKCLR